LSQHIAATVEESVPERFRDDGDPRRTGVILVRRERAAFDRRESGDGEERRRGVGADQAPRIAAARQVEGVAASGRDGVEHARARLPLEEPAGRQREFWKARRRRVADHRQPVRLRVRQRTQDNGVEDAEDGGRAGDGDRERQDGDGRIGRLLGEDAKGSPEIGHRPVRRENRAERWSLTMRDVGRPTFRPH
jgi:hypothetical protein